MRYLAVFLAGVVLAGGVALALWWRDSANPLVASDAPQEHPTAPIGTSTSTDARPARWQIEWTEPVTVNSGAVAGTVTAIGVFDPVRTGRPLLLVDGRPRFLVVGGSPLYRPVSRRDSGLDVRNVSRLLISLGHLPEPPRDTVDAAFVSAIRRFERDAGWPRTGTFRPDYAIWADDGIGGIELSVDIGDVIGPQHPLGSTHPAISSAKLLATGDNTPVVLDSFTPWEVSMQSGDTFAVDAAGKPDVRDTARLRAALDGAPSPASNPFGAAPEQTQGTAAVQVVVRRTTQVERQDVPTSAVAVGPAGLSCVIDADGRVHRVEVLDGLAGVTHVVPSLPDGVRVRLSPTQADAEACV